MNQNLVNIWWVHTARHRHRHRDRQIVTLLNGTVVSVPCEHLHTILYNPFFIGVYRFWCRAVGTH